MKQPFISQTAVVGYPHPIKGEGICCFCTLTLEHEKYPDLLPKLRNSIRATIGPFAIPDIICVTPGLPLTRSGKVMRRILRKIASGDIHELGDTTTLSNPSVVEVLIENMESIQK